MIGQVFSSTWPNLLLLNQLTEIAQQGQGRFDLTGAPDVECHMAVWNDFFCVRKNKGESFSFQ